MVRQKSALAGRRPGVDDLYAAVMEGAIERMISSTVLTLTVIPAIYALIEERRLSRS